MERQREDGVVMPVERETPAIHVMDNSPDVRVVDTSPDVRMSAQVIEPRDRVRWGPIWAGLITTLTTFLVLELLMYGLGLLTVDVNPGANGTSGPWVTAIVGLVAFLAGGWIAGATAAVRGSGAGMANGFMVWGLATLMILVFSTLGLSQLFGPVGSALSGFINLSNFNMPQNVNIDPAQIADQVRTGALWATLSLVLTAVAAAVGGWLGVKSGPLGRARG
ncbi:MAG: permease [Chloroflexota bacterium]|nr:permease [Chloroflexota bacterium]